MKIFLESFYFFFFYFYVLLFDLISFQQFYTRILYNNLQILYEISECSQCQLFQTDYIILHTKCKQFFFCIKRKQNRILRRILFFFLLFSSKRFFCIFTHLQSSSFYRFFLLFSTEVPEMFRNKCSTFMSKLKIIQEVDIQHTRQRILYVAEFLIK